MTALILSAPAGTAVPAPRAAVPQIPAQRGPVDRAPAAPGHRAGRHRVVATGRGAARSARPAELVRLAARAGSVVTLAAMLVMAAAAAGLSDGVAPTGDAAKVATATLR